MPLDGAYVSIFVMRRWRVRFSRVAPEGVREPFFKEWFSGIFQCFSAVLRADFRREIIISGPVKIEFDSGRAVFKHETQVGGQAYCLEVLIYTIFHPFTASFSSFKLHAPPQAHIFTILTILHCQGSRHDCLPPPLSSYGVNSNHRYDF